MTALGVALIASPLLVGGGLAPDARSEQASAPPVVTDSPGAGPAPQMADLLLQRRGADTTEGAPVGADGRLADGTTWQQYLPVLAAASSLRALAVPPTDGLMALADPRVPAAGKVLRVPAVVLDAYRTAARRLAADRPACGMSAALLAGIGQAESGHARGGRVTADGTTRQPILGPVLDGTGGTAAISDTDDGRLDGDTTWDRAAGPMQFIPSTWRSYRSDGNGDGTADINNVYDASLAAGRYLCAGGDDVRKPAQAAAAVFRYNHSATYVATVLSWAAAYAGGLVAAPDPARGADADDPAGPPVDPGAARSPAAPAKPKRTPASGPATKAVVYTVKRGDNLSKIAWWFHVHGYGPLYDANRATIGADPDLIFPGQRITVALRNVRFG